MRRPIAQSFGALALAAALTTSSTTAFAAPTVGTLEHYLTKKKTTTTLVGLSRQISTSAVEKARSRPGAPKLTTQGGTQQSGPSDLELDLICADDWIIAWEEDADGDPILGTFVLDCAGTIIPIG